MTYQFQRVILGGMLASVLAGCSAADATSMTDSEGGEGEAFAAAEERDPNVALLASPDLEEREAAFQQLVSAQLLEAEREEIELYLQANGIGMEEVSFVGRIVVVGDTQTAADDWLEAASLDKGRVLSAAFTSTNGTPGPTPQLPVAPFIYARMNAGKFEFWRPTQHHHMVVVVPDSPTFLLQLMKNTVSRYLSADTSDCLSGTAGAESIRVMTASAFNQLSTSEKQSTPCVNVVHGPQQVSCPATGLTSAGCSLAMRPVSIKVGSVFENRVVIGPRIGLNSFEVTGTDSSSMSIALHELGHTLGMAHPFQSTSQSLTVPGTSGSAKNTSVMQNRCKPAEQQQCSLPEADRPACCSFFPLLTPDDKKTVGTLYRSLPSTGCSYVNNFQVIPAL